MQPIGLQNIGNTCYMNSVIQLLMMCTSFINVLKQLNSNSDIVNEFKIFITKYEQATSPIPPFEVKKIISRHKMFEGFDQHDAHEFLIYIIDMLDEELKAEGYSSISEAIFNHKYYTKIINQEFKEEKLIKFHETILSLPLSKSMNESYAMFCEFEDIEGWESEINKQKVLAKKHNIVYKWPKHLFILFKKYNNNSMKIESQIDIPMVWTIENQYNGKIQTDVYNFCGSVIHFGNMFGGHYISVVHKNENFYLCNDGNISQIDESQGLQLIKRSYLLLYSKV